MVGYGGALPYDVAIKLPLSEIERLATNLGRYNKDVENDSKK